MTDAYSVGNSVAKTLWKKLAKMGVPVREPELLNIVAKSPYQKKDRKKLNGYLQALEKAGCVNWTKGVKANYWDVPSAQLIFLNQKRVQIYQKENGAFKPLMRSQTFKEMVNQQKKLRNFGIKYLREEEVARWHRERKLKLKKITPIQLPDNTELRKAVQEYINYYLQDSSFSKKLDLHTVNHDIVDTSYTLAVKKNIVMQNGGYTITWQTFPGSNYFFSYNILEGIRIGGIRTDEP